MGRRAVLNQLEAGRVINLALSGAPVPEAVITEALMALGEDVEQDFSLTPEIEDFVKSLRDSSLI